MSHKFNSPLIKTVKKMQATTMLSTVSIGFGMPGFNSMMSAFPRISSTVSPEATPDAIQAHDLADGGKFQLQGFNYECLKRRDLRLTGMSGMARIAEMNLSLQATVQVRWPRFDRTTNKWSECWWAGTVLRYTGECYAFNGKRRGKCNHNYGGCVPIILMEFPDHQALGMQEQVREVAFLNNDTLVDIGEWHFYGRDPNWMDKPFLTAWRFPVNAPLVVPMQSLVLPMFTLQQVQSLYELKQTAPVFHRARFDPTRYQQAIDQMVEELNFKIGKVEQTDLDPETQLAVQKFFQLLNECQMALTNRKVDMSEREVEETTASIGGYLERLQQDHRPLARTLVKLALVKRNKRLRAVSATSGGRTAHARGLDNMQLGGSRDATSE